MTIGFSNLEVTGDVDQSQGHGGGKSEWVQEQVGGREIVIMGI